MQQEQLLRINVKRSRGGLVFKAHRLLYHSTLGLRVIKNKRKWRRHTRQAPSTSPPPAPSHPAAPNKVQCVCERERERETTGCEPFAPHKHQNSGRGEGLASSTNTWGVMGSVIKDRGWSSCAQGKHPPRLLHQLHRIRHAKKKPSGTRIPRS